MKARLVVVGALLLAVFAAGWLANGWRLGTDMADQRRAHAEALAAASERARQTERGWQAAMEKVTQDAKIERNQVEADAADAAADIDRLRKALADRTATATCNSAATGRGSSAIDTLILYSELLDAAVERAGQLAAEADRRGVAGAACVMAYEALLPE